MANRVAALYDIHGNLPALEAVVDDVRKADADQIVVGGDVFPGPMSRQSLDFLLDLDIPVQFIHGNGDRVVLAQKQGEELPEVPEQARGVIRWNAQQLRPEDEAMLAGWPHTLSVEIPGLGDVLFCHATPINDTDVFTRLTPDHVLLPLFEPIDASLVVCGHTHMQFDRMLGKVRVVNAGSVGMPFGEPGAYWLLLGPKVELRRTSYDLEKAVARIRGTNYPEADVFAERSILHPQSENQVLEAFAKVAPK